MKFELNYDGFDEDDFEREIIIPFTTMFNHEDELIPMIIAEYQPDDDFVFLISVDSRVFVSGSLGDIVWFLQSHINQIRQLIQTHGPSMDFESAVMRIYIELYSDFQEAYQKSLILKNDEIDEDEDDFVFPDDLDKL